MSAPEGLQREHPWYPHPDAIAAGVAKERFMDADDFIDRYLLRCKDLDKKPRSGEWLRWYLDEDAAARLRERAASRRGEPEVDDSGVPTTWSKH